LPFSCSQLLTFTFIVIMSALEQEEPLNTQFSFLVDPSVKTGRQSIIFLHANI